MTPREVDAWVLRFLDLLGADGRQAYTMERLIRMGLFSLPHPTVAQAAEKIGVIPRALNRQMERGGLPHPRALIMWGRLLRALHSYGAGMSLEKAAHAHGFADQSRLSMATVAHAGISASEWRTRGASMNELIGALVAGRRTRQKAAA